MIGMPYVRGTYGKIGNRDMLELKRRQYSEQFINDYDYILENWEFFNNKPWHDAPGLIKGYYWQNERGSIVYKLDARAYLSAGGLYSASDKKGPISEMPNLPGLLVYYPGHIRGIYIGNGEIVEALDVKARGRMFIIIRASLHPLVSLPICYIRKNKKRESLSSYPDDIL